MASSGATAVQLPAGLTSAEAAARLKQHGLNRVEEERRRPVLAFLSKFWAPVPWMLEATVILEILVHKRDEAIIISVLLLVNAVLSFVQENQANHALQLLRSQLKVQARVLRDGRWQLLPAEQLVPGDVIHLRLGDLAPADVQLLDGLVQVDESELTGESLPVEKAAGAPVYAGSRLKHGEADGQVTATGSHTYFGKTADLVKTAKTASHLQEIILAIVKYLVALDGALVAALLIYAAVTHLPWAEVLPFALILLVASVPVALPATFTVATALGALDMSHHAVIVTRLSAVEEAAAMDVLCTDKTGTITQNRLSVGEILPVNGRSTDEVLRMAALASDDSTQDPIDLTILAAAREKKLLHAVPARIRYIPFDPSTKRAEAVYDGAGGKLRVVKGAPDALVRIARADGTVSEEVAQLASRGDRVLGVAGGTDSTLEMYGLLGLEDPLRDDSKALVDELKSLGVRTIMVTGDGAATARAVSTEVGIGDRVGSVANLQDGLAAAADHYDAFAGVFPEDKFRLVAELQKEGHIVGMTGDGVNDAPALKQAEVGIAVSNATDVAKAAASMVLTESGLGGIVRAIETGRKIYQRMLTYTLNKIIKTFEIAIFLSLGVMLTGTFVVTPLLVVLLLFTNDFVTMSIATDRVSFSSKPDRWDIRTLMMTAGTLSAFVLVLSFAVFFAGRDYLHLPLRQLQTLVFLMLVFTGQGNVYLVRERGHFWSSRPSRWLMISSVADVIVVSLMATRGILMAPIAWGQVGGLLLVVLAFLFVVDGAKIRVFRHFGVE
jgi:H+-transporting ATPase